MTLSLSHSQHVQTQKGLATQGRGLDNEDLPCFEGEELFPLRVATFSKFLQSTSFANPFNALKAHGFSTNPNSGQIFTSCSGLEMLAEKSQTHALGRIMSCGQGPNSNIDVSADVRSLCFHAIF